jgi:hypothetical protein
MNMNARTYLGFLRLAIPVALVGLGLHGRCEPKSEVVSTNQIQCSPSKEDAGTMPSLEAFEARLNSTVPRKMRLPNFESGPGRPRPVGVNLYEQRDYYPGYLLCSYDVDEKLYDVSKESSWFQASLSLIRRTGSNSFPSFRYVAVIICNRAEHKGVSTFEQSYKAGALFKASDVFNPEYPTEKLVQSATIDRRPLKYDPTQPTPGQQQRWLIVEQHVATNKLDTVKH